MMRLTMITVGTVAGLIGLGGLPGMPVSGTRVATATVTVYDGSTVAGTTTVGSGGSYSLNVTLSYGVHSLTATWVCAGCDGSAPAVATIRPAPSVTTTSVATRFAAARPGVITWSCQR